MTAGIALAAVALGWAGAVLFTLSDGRRGLGFGLLVAGGGLALAQLAGGDPVVAGLIGAGAVLATVASQRGVEAAGWQFLPPGSTPRIVLSLVLGGAALWFGGAVLEGPGEWQVRGACAIVIALAGARALTAGEIGTSLAAASLVALAAAGLAGQRPAGGPAALLAVLGAIGLNLIPWLSRRDLAGESSGADA